jgi:hypothetical protein
LTVKKEQIGKDTFGFDLPQLNKFSFVQKISTLEPISTKIIIFSFSFNRKSYTYSAEQKNWLSNISMAKKGIIRDNQMGKTNSVIIVLQWSHLEKLQNIEGKKYSFCRLVSCMKTTTTVRLTVRPTYYIMYYRPNALGFFGGRKIFMSMYYNFGNDMTQG